MYWRVFCGPEFCNVAFLFEISTVISVFMNFSSVLNLFIFSCQVVGLGGQFTIPALFGSSPSSPRPAPPPPHPHPTSAPLSLASLSSEMDSSEPGPVAVRGRSPDLGNPQLR